MGGRRLREQRTTTENMEVIGDVEWQLGNFTLEICQIILDAFTQFCLPRPTKQIRGLVPNYLS